MTLNVYGEAGRAVPTSNLQSIVPVSKVRVWTQSGPYVVEPTTSVTLNFVLAGRGLPVAFTCT